MSSLQNEIRSTEITRFISDPAQIKALREHVEQLVHGDAFRASPRSQQFLRYVVEKAIQGDFDSLKERVIGVELFRRPPSFDTGEDSIVRVTASDVRKRLLQHYGRYGDGADVRLAIPSGSYIPEISWSRHPDPLPLTPPVVEDEVPVPEEKAVPAPVVSQPALTAPPVALAPPRSSANVWLLALAGVVVCSAISFWLGNRNHKTEAPSEATKILPWSSILRPDHTLQVVTSDPDFAAEQDITRHSATLADYANQLYMPEGAQVAPDLRTFAQKYLQGRDIADVDIPIATDIAVLAGRIPERIGIRSARSLRLRDFHTDDDFVLLGSPLSNPWSDLYADQLDFRFKFVDQSSLQAIENVRPQAGEAALYSPVGRGFTAGPSSGTSFGIVAFVDNPNQSGHVLLLAGTGSEGTEAAGRLATNFEDLSAALKKCNPPAGVRLEHFEILLRTGIMAGSPSSSEIIACHILPSNQPGK